ncbi:MAG: cysQ [Rickettsiales bacterium]|jgi:3'(2'), 5'-bisphosphate nucleotidase|nr:cysQ [Rickettsiales bacterium]
MTQFPPIHQVVTLAIQAGKGIMQHYQGEVVVTRKEDASPVTIADTEANAFIVEGLARLTPNIPVVSEENPSDVNELARQSPVFWLVDPLDGTKSFIKKTGEFTVNIALVQNHKPVRGVIYVPAKGSLYYTGDDGFAYKDNGTRISVRSLPSEGAVVVASMSHLTPETEAYIASIKVQKLMSASSSIKLCLVAEGLADIYPRFGRTMEWDIGAGHAILNAAGGSVINSDGSPFLYGKAGLDNGNFIARGKSSY